MSFLQRIKEINNLDVNDPKAWDSSLWRMAGAISESGEVVDEYTAMTYSAVWCAINLISGTIASLPLHLMQNQGKNKRMFEDYSLYYVMHDQWNPFMTALNGRRCSMAHVLSWGNSYAEIVKNGYGDIVQLWPIPPNRVLKIEMREDLNLWYEIQIPKSANVWLPREKILHIAGLGFDGFIGYSPIAMARKGIGLGMAMETFGSRFFAHGTNPSAVVTHPNSFKDPKTVRNAISEVYAGLGNTHRLLLLEEAMEFEQIGIKPEESQFLQSREFQIPEIARWFNIPPHKLKDLTKSSFNNIESEQISFVTDSILPWLVGLEQEYKMQLLTKSQVKTQKLYFKHIVEGLLRANAKDRSDFYKAAVGSGWMTPNEVREKEDMNPSPDPKADELWMPQTLIPMSKFDEYLSKNTGNQKQITEGNDDENTEPKPVQTANILKIQDRK